MSRILIVDDSPAQLHQLQQMVEQVGHQAVTAVCGEDALEIAASQLPELILMDIVMPGMSGYTATRKLGRDELTRHIPIIFISSKDGDADRVWGLRQGAKDYITKPVNRNLLLSAISMAMAA
jgi:twitching motility two-component system response regulator PilH